MGDLIERQAAIDAILGMFLKIAYSEKNVAWSMALDKIRQLPSAQRWIPCSERLPNVNGDYLVTFRYLIFYPVEVCEFKDGKWESGMYDVVAWSLLPDPYREDGAT